LGVGGIRNYIGINKSGARIVEYIWMDYIRGKKIRFISYHSVVQFMYHIFYHTLYYQLNLTLFTLIL